MPPERVVPWVAPPWRPDELRCEPVERPPWLRDSCGRADSLRVDWDPPRRLRLPAAPLSSRVRR
jgi:hypothetical protein